MATRRLELTPGFLNSLKPADKEFEIEDTKSGVQLLVRTSGVRTWVLRYWFERQRKLTIGAYSQVSLKEARRRAVEAKGQIAGGTDPQAQKIASRAAAKAAKAAAKIKAAEEAEPVDLIERVVDRFTAMHRLNVRARTSGETARLLRHNVESVWRGRRLSAITPAEATALIDDIFLAGKGVLANRVVAALKLFGKWASARGFANPFAALVKPAVEVPRERVLDEGEIRALLQALDAESYPWKQLVTLLLMTGARRGEIAEMRWREVNFDTGVWTLPAERSKNGEAHALPLPDAALDILRGLEKFEWSDLVFSNDGGRTRVRSFNGVSKRLAARMKLAEEWTLHDLRRSAASGMADVDVAPHIIEAVIGHKSGVIKGIARVYNRHTYDREQLAALTKWAERLEKIKSGQETKKVVVLMRR